VATGIPGHKDSFGKDDFTCDRFISSPGMRPVALTLRGSEDANRNFCLFGLLFGHYGVVVNGSEFPSGGGRSFWDAPLC